MENKKNTTSVSVLLSLFKLLGPLKFNMLCAILLGAAGHILAFSLGIFGIYAVLSKFIGSEDMHDLYFSSYNFNTYIKFLIIFAVLRGILHYLEQYFNHLIAFKILARIRHEVFKAMDRLAPSKLESKNKGQLISLIVSDIELLEVFYAHTISPIVIAFISALLLFIFYAKISIYLALFSLFSEIFISLYLSLNNAKKIDKISLDIREQLGDLNDKFIDKIRGIRETIQYSNYKASSIELEKITKEILEKQEILKKQNCIHASNIELSIMLSALMQFLLASFLLANDQISLAQAIVSCMLMIASFGPFISLANLGSILSSTISCGKRVLAILDEDPLVKEVEEAKEFINGDIEFIDASFSYNLSENVIDNFNLKIGQGTMIGIMGESGSGKSTILKLLMRFWDLNCGKILIGKENIKDYSLDSLHGNINYMTQETFIFTGSIRENLLIGNPLADEEQINDALDKAALKDFVHSLEDGLDTFLGEDGLNLSGGERQRLGLARCFLSDKPIFLIDEATSNLDSINEAIILKSLFDNKKDKTIILISHRESTLAICDKMITI